MEEARPSRRRFSLNPFKFQRNKSSISTIHEEETPSNTGSTVTTDDEFDFELVDKTDCVRGIRIPNFKSELMHLEQIKAQEMLKQYKLMSGDVNLERRGSVWRPPESWGSSRRPSVVVPPPITITVRDDTEFQVTVYESIPTHWNKLIPEELLQCEGLNVPCTSKTTALDIVRSMSVLDDKRYGLYLIKQGNERLLGDNECPVLVQADIMNELGYHVASRDEICPAQPWYFMFELREKSFVQVKPSHVSRILSLPRKVNLSNLNIDLLPIRLFEMGFCTIIESLDVSGNVRLSYPEDFFASCLSLSALDMSFNELSILPFAIKRCVSLKRLNLGRNRLTSISIESLVNLNVLDVSGNELIDIECINELRNLKHLNISNNRITTLSVNLPGLISLNASYNQLEMIECHKCISLESLLLKGNNLTSLPQLKPLRSLSHVNVSLNPISDLSCCSSVKVLEVEGCAVNLVPEYMWHLQSISLKNNKSLTRFNAAMHNVTRINLSGCSLDELDDSMFSTCGLLSELNLSLNNLTLLPSSLFSCTSLQKLDISRNNLTKLDGLEHLNLVELIAFSNKLTMIPEGLKAVTMNLSWNKLESISIISNCNYLFLGNNFLTDESLEIIGQMIQLIILDLGCNKIFDISCLSSLTCLKELYLQGNQIAKLCDEMENWKTLEVLVIHSNRFVSLPKDISCLQNLVLLDASGNDLHYNLKNSGYDWNWNHNPTLTHLDLSFNRRLQLDCNSFSDKNNLEFLGISGVGFSPLMMQNVDKPEAIIRMGKDSKVIGWEQHQYKARLVEWSKGVCIIAGDRRVVQWLQERVLPEHFESEDSIYRCFINFMRLYSMEWPNSTFHASCGSVYVCNNQVHITSLGDVEYVVCSDGDTEIIGKSHVLANELECYRLRRGYVAENGLCNGQYHVTSAFGLTCQLPFISSVPKVRILPKKAQDYQFVIMADSVFWTWVTHKEAVKIVQSHPHIGLATKVLKGLALGRGCRDAFSVVIYSLSETESSLVVPIRKSITNYLQTCMTPIQKSPCNQSPPVGTMAMVFSDIKQSTRLWQDYNMSFKSALSIHNSLVRECISSTCGYEVFTEGDSFFVVFQNIKNAIEFCSLVQRRLLLAAWPKDLIDCDDITKPVYDGNGNLIYCGLSVRMGIHYGTPFKDIEPLKQRTNFVGPEVALARRVSDAADGGQIFLSEQAFKEASNHDIHSVQYFDMGMRFLKEFEQPRQLYSVYPHSLIARHDETITRSTNVECLVKIYSRLTFIIHDEYPFLVDWIEPSPRSLEECVCAVEKIVRVLELVHAIGRERVEKLIKMFDRRDCFGLACMLRES